MNVDSTYSLTGLSYRVYGTVVKSLGEFFTPEKQAQFSWEYIVEVRLLLLSPLADDPPVRLKYHSIYIETQCVCSSIVG